MGFPPPKSITQLGGQRSLQQVAQRTGCNGEFGAVGGTNPFLVMHSRHLCPGGADAIQLVYSGLAAGPVEARCAPSVFGAVSVTLTGTMTGYVVGEVIQAPSSNTTAIGPAQVMVTAVSAGVPTQYQVIDPGVYLAPLAAAVAQAGSTGAGTGALLTFGWSASAGGLHVGIEPQWGSQTVQGQYPIQLAGKGSTARGLIQWNALIPMGDVWVSDLIAVDVPVGGAIGIRLSGAGPSLNMGRQVNGNFYRFGGSGGPTSANDEWSQNVSTFTDYSVSGTFTATFNNNIYQPSLILGLPKKQLPSVFCLYADSRAAKAGGGTGAIGGNIDYLDIDGNQSWFEKAMSQTTGLCFWPWANFARGSDRASYAIPASNLSPFQGREERRKAVMLARPTAVYINLSVNDFINQETAATVLAYEQQLVAEVRGAGVKYVFTDTTDPNTTSTDSWATTTNQTLSQTQTTNIQIRNAALRAGTYAAGYDFFIDQGPNTEYYTAGAYTGKWLPNATADGIHAVCSVIQQKAATAAAVIAAKISP